MTKNKRRGGEFRSRQADRGAQSADDKECKTCGEPLSPRARFCHRCGTPLAGTPARDPTGSRKRTSLIVYSVAAVSVLGATLVAVFLTYSDSPGPAPPPMESPATTGPSSVDLSTMTPRQAADRLFNRVMSASERGDMDEAARFAPMAVAAYGRVANLDLDARYHLGLLHLVQGDLDQARAQIEIMKQSVPRHLLALVLEHNVATRSGDEAAADRAADEFVAAYEDEVATGRPEYEAHRFSIDRFRSTELGGETTPAVSAQPPAANSGEAVFVEKCAQCHGREAQGTDKGPPLVHKIYEPSHHADAAFYLAVRQGVRAHHWPFGDMPPVPGVSNEDIDRVVAYVRGLQRAAGIE